MGKWQLLFGSMDVLVWSFWIIGDIERMIDRKFLVFNAFVYFR